MGENQENAKNSDGTSQRENHPKSIRKIAKERRLDILNKVIKKVGFRNARERTKSLAKTYGISERNIRKDFEWIQKNVQPEDREEIKITVRMAIDNALDTALERFVTEPTIENSKNIMQLAKQYREEIEAWGEKEKITDKQEFEGMAGTFNLITQSVEEIKNERNKNRGSKSGISSKQEEIIDKKIEDGELGNKEIKKEEKDQ